MVYPWQLEYDQIANDPFIFNDPVLGLRPGKVDGNIEYMRAMGTGQVPDAPILQSEIVNRLPKEMDQFLQKRLALEMFLNVDSAYSDAKEVFEDDGTVNQDTFISAVLATLSMAATAGPAGLNTTTKYLDILMNRNNTDFNTMMQQFYEKKQESTFGLSSAVINDLLDTGFSNVLGRGANKREQKAFTEMILRLEDSVNQTDITTEAEAFARANRPIEAEAMSLSNAAGAVMRVLGMGV